MRKLIVQEYASLDGFVADAKGGLAFTGPYARGAEIDKDAGHLIDSIDTIVLGEVTYQLFVKIWPERTNSQTIIADSFNSTPKIVFSQKLAEAPWGKWPAAKVSKNRAEKEVAELKQQPGKDIIVWGSISLAQSLIKAGLVDEYQLLVCPVALGEGRKLFTPDEVLSLKLLETKPYASGLVLMRYAPAPAS